MDNPEITIKLLKKAISFGKNLPNKYWDSHSSNCIGSSIVDLFTYFKLPFSEVSKRLMILGYCYLSNCIKVLGMNAYESFQSRGSIFDMTGKTNMEEALIPMSQISIVYSIPDYLDAYYSYKNHGFIQRAYNVYKRAEHLHYYLENINVAGKPANFYTLEEIAAIGRQRHKEIYLSFKEDVLNGKYNISKKQLDNLLNSILIEKKG